MAFLLARRSLVFCQATSRTMVRSHWRLASRFVRHVEFYQRATHVRQPCPFNIVRECIYTSLHHVHFPSSSSPPPSPGIEKSEEQRDVLRALPVSCQTTQSVCVSFLWSFSSSPKSKFGYNMCARNSATLRYMYRPLVAQEP